MMQILNLYAYVNNNPLIYTDPTGLFLIGIIIGGAIIGGAVAGANRPPSGGGSSGGNNPIPSMPPPGHNTGSGSGGSSGSSSGGNNPIPSVPPPNLAVGGSGNNSGSQPSVNLTPGGILGNLIAGVVNNAINRVVSNAQASNRANSSAQGTATTIYVPVGNNAFAEQRGYIVNGQTVLADGSRIQNGTIVRTASGYYQMLNGSGVRVNRPNNVVGSSIIVPTAIRPASPMVDRAVQNILGIEPQAQVGVTVEGISATVAFGLALGGSIYRLSDHHGNRAIVVMPEWGAGIGGSIGGEQIRFPTMDNIFEFGGYGGTTTFGIDALGLGAGHSIITDGMHRGYGGDLSGGKLRAEVTATTPFTIWWVHTWQVR